MSNPNLSNLRKSAVLVCPVPQSDSDTGLDLVRRSLDIGPMLAAGASASMQPLWYLLPQMGKGTDDKNVIYPLELLGGWSAVMTSRTCPSTKQPLNR